VNFRDLGNFFFQKMKERERDFFLKGILSAFLGAIFQNKNN